MYGVEIWTHDLKNMSLVPYPLNQGSRPKRPKDFYLGQMQKLDCRKLFLYLLQICWKISSNNFEKFAPSGHTDCIEMYKSWFECSWDYDEDEWGCRRLDQTNLISKFLRKSDEVPGFEGKTGKFVENREQLLSIDTANTDYLLGEFLVDLLNFSYWSIRPIRCLHQSTIGRNFGFVRLTVK